MDRAKVEAFVSGLLVQHCGAKAASNANTVRHFTDAILTGAATPDSVRTQIVQLAQTQQLAQHLIKNSPPTSPLLPLMELYHKGSPRVGEASLAPIPPHQEREPAPHTSPSVTASAATSQQQTAWSSDERLRFLEAYELFGAGDWENISAHVATRSLAEVRQYGAEHQEYLERKREQIEREKLMQQERQLEERMRQLELQLQQEREALMNSQPMKVSNAFDQAVQRELNRQEHGLARESTSNRTAEDELVQQLVKQTLHEESLTEEQQLKELARQQREEIQAEALRQQELEMERKIALLQQQIVAEKARIGTAGQSNPFLQFPAVQYAPTPQPVPSSHPSPAPTQSPTSPLTATTPAVPVGVQPTSRPAQFSFKPSSPSLPLPATTLTDYELLFHNVSLPPTLPSAAVPAGPAPSTSIQRHPVPPPSTTATTTTTSPIHAPVKSPIPSISVPSTPAHDLKRAPAPTASHPTGLSSGAIPDITPLVSASAASSSNKQDSRYELEQVKQYVTELYKVYAGGKLSDPATFRWHVDSIMNGSYSLSQAEYSIRFSKEAKEYAKQQQQRQEAKVKQMQEYVRELMRVYCKRAPTEDELKRYVNSILSGQANLQQVEDEVKLLGLSVPTNRPSTRP